MAGPSMSRHDSRARAERVVLLRAVLRKPWREIMRSENFGAPPSQRGHR